MPAKGKTDKGYGRNMLPCGVRTMRVEEASWVGAMLDAEGCVLTYTIRNINEVRLSLGNTEPEVLSALLRATGVGNVRGTKRKQPHHLPFFVWDVSRWNDVMDIARQCAPFSLKAQRVLTERRRIDAS